MEQESDASTGLRASTAPWRGWSAPATISFVRWDGSQDSVVTGSGHFAVNGGAGNGSLAHIRFTDSGSLWNIGAGQLVLGGAGDDILAIDQYQSG